MAAAAAAVGGRMDREAYVGGGGLCGRDQAQENSRLERHHDVRFGWEGASDGTPSARHGRQHGKEGGGDIHETTEGGWSVEIEMLPTSKSKGWDLWSVEVERLGSVECGPSTISQGGGGFHFSTMPRTGAGTLLPRSSGSASSAKESASSERDSAR